MVTKRRTAAILSAGLLVAAFLASPGPGAAQEADPAAAFQAIPWQSGPSVATIGSQAQIQLPAGYLYVGPAGSQDFLRLTGNLPDPSVLGILLPESDAESWFVVFSFEDCGRVPDDEQDALDADAILASLQAGNAAANGERRSQGLPELQLAGWTIPPMYEPNTNRLVWALRVVSNDGEAVNHNTRLLGRHGVMSVELVGDPAEMNAAVAKVNELLVGYEFTSGNRYAEWRAGDKIAAVGLTGLVAGGLGVAAAKSGLLGKLGLLLAKGGKFILVAVVGGAALLWRLLTGRRTASE